MDGTTVVGEGMVKCKNGGNERKSTGDQSRVVRFSSRDSSFYNEFLGAIVFWFKKEMVKRTKFKEDFASTDVGL